MAAFDPISEVDRFVRPPNIVVGGFKFYHDFSPSSSSLLFVSYCPSSLNGTQPKPGTCSEVSAIWNACPNSEILGIPPLKIGGPKTTFFDNCATLQQLLRPISLEWRYRLISSYWPRMKSVASLPKKLELKNIYICSVSRRFRDLMTNIFWTKYHYMGPLHLLYRKSAKCVEDYRGFPTLSQNVKNFGVQTA